MMLSNFNVLITRPGQAGVDLCAKVKAYGGSAHHFPTIVFAPPEDQKAYQAILNNLSTYDMLVFISPHAAKVTSRAMLLHGQKTPIKPRIAAVGEGTKKVLSEEGFVVDYVPRDNWGSEGLLSLPAFRDLQGQRILIICGAGGRENLAEILAQRGAEVTHLIAYRRLMPNILTPEQLSLMNLEKIHAIVCTSFTGVHHLKILLTPEGWPNLQPIPLVVVSKRICDLAKTLEFSHIYIAENASHEAILQTLIQIRNKSCQKK